MKFNFDIILYAFGVLGMLVLAVLFAMSLDQYMEETKFLERMAKERATLAENLTMADRGIGLNVTPSKPRSSSVFHVLYIMYICYASVAFATLSVNLLFILLIKIGYSFKWISYWRQKIFRLSLYFIWIPFLIILTVIALLK